MRNVLSLPIVGAAALLLFAPPAEAQEKRAALVLGNGAYKEVAKLPNPPNDARAVAAAVKRLGFAVTDGYDLTIQEMIAKIRAFGRSLEAAGADVAFVFYAGHGMQVAGRNYLLPVDAKLEREQDLLYEAVALDTVLDEAQGARRLRVVILDACRDNPFTVRMVRAMGNSRAALIGRGLRRVDNLPTDTLVAYATATDAVAEDGAGGNSPYTTALLQNLNTPGLEINLFFGRVRDAVLKMTGGRQQPFTYGSLGGEAFFLYPAEGKPTPPPIAVINPDVVFWTSIQNSADPADFEDYLRQYPKGAFASLAERKLKALKTVAAASSRPAAPKPSATAKQAPLEPAVTRPPEPAPKTGEPTTTCDAARGDLVQRMLEKSKSYVPYTCREADGEVVTVAVFPARSQGNFEICRDYTVSTERNGRATGKISSVSCRSADGRWRQYQ